MQQQNNFKAILKSFEEDIEEVLARLEELRNRVAQLLGEEVELAPPVWMQKKLKLWWLIYKQGGQVSVDKLYEIAERVGYDHRGLGGFFTGKRPSLIKVVGGKLALANWAAKEVEKYREWLEKYLQD